MKREPNLIISSFSQSVVEDGIPFKVDIYKLEGGDGWSLEVVTEDGTSIVWDDLFEDDRAAFEEAGATILKEGAVGFANGGSNVIPFRQRAAPVPPFSAVDFLASLWLDVAAKRTYVGFQLPAQLDVHTVPSKTLKWANEST